jgi:sugar lactone lactonase YvrE
MKASGIVSPDLTELINLNLVREGVLAGGMAMSDGKLYILDSQGGRVIEVNLSKGSGNVVGGGVTGGRLIAGYPGKVLVLAEKGLLQLGISDPKVKVDNAWKDVVGMKLFGGNIYLLDSGSGEIWRYGVSGDSYGNKQGWLADNENRGVIEAASGMAIDGSIWIVGSSGIDKYTRGVKDAYEITDLETLWGDGAKIYTFWTRGILGLLCWVRMENIRDNM